MILLKSILAGEADRWNHSHGPFCYCPIFGSARQQYPLETGKGGELDPQEYVRAKGNGIRGNE